MPAESNGPLPRARWGHRSGRLVLWRFRYTVTIEYQSATTTATASSATTRTSGPAAKEDARETRPACSAQGHANCDQAMDTFRLQVAVSSPAYWMTECRSGRHSSSPGGDQVHRRPPAGGINHTIHVSRSHADSGCVVPGRRRT